LKLNLFGNDFEKAIVLATANDREVPDSEEVNAIAEVAFTLENFNIVFKKVWERCDQKPKDWKVVYKV
jgi:hypothetical protein